MKQHHFVLHAVELEDGTIEWAMEDPTLYLNDGVIWDTEEDRWHYTESEAEEIRDEKMTADLLDKLFGDR
jgi:hypothetical protein